MNPPRVCCGCLLGFKFNAHSIPAEHLRQALTGAVRDQQRYGHTRQQRAIGRKRPTGQRRHVRQYHFFPNGKQQIAAEALAVYSQRVLDFIDKALASKRRPHEKVKALFDAFARRVEDGEFSRSCAVGAVALDLDADLEALRVVLAAAFSEWAALIARHFDFGYTPRTKSSAGLVLTAIEGAYIRCRAERSSRPFKEAGVWLAELAAMPA